MAQFNFQDIDNINAVADALGCEASFIQSVFERPSAFYSQIRVPRRNRPEPRIVYEVHDDLRNLHKNILTAIAEKVNFPEYVQGFVSKRSIVTNASLHLGRKYILNLDIKDFFESIKIDKITQVFQTLRCNESTALIFAQLCTFNECLVQGANTSPILANLVCTELDKKLVQLGNEYNCSYSRYADDITFSGESVPEKKKISKCLENYGFQLNPHKYKYQSRGRPQYVTGLTVFDDVMPRIPKRVKKQVRQILYYIKKYGLEDHLERINSTDDGIMNWLDGLIAFMYSVEPKRAYAFDMDWQEILREEDMGSSRDPSKVLTKRQSQHNLSHSNFILAGIQSNE